MGQLFMAAGQPVIFQLNYCWPEDCRAGHSAQAAQPLAMPTLLPQSQPHLQLRPSAKRKLDVEQKMAAKRTAAPAVPAFAGTAASAVSALQVSAAPQPQQLALALQPSCQGTAAQASPSTAPAGGVAPATQQQEPSSQAAGREDSLFGMAWPPPSLLVTPSLLGPPSLAPPEQLAGSAPASGTAAAAPASAAAASVPASAPSSFQPLLAGTGAASAAHQTPAATSSHASAEHSNWRGSLAELLGGPRLNGFGLEESRDAFAAGWGHGRGPQSRAGTHPPICLTAIDFGQVQG